MSKNYPRPFTPAWEKEVPRISVVGPKVISEKAVLPIGIIDLSVTETFIPVPLFEPPTVIVEERIKIIEQEAIIPEAETSVSVPTPIVVVTEEVSPIIIPPKAINYRNLILVGLSGGLLGTVIYVILRLLGAF